ncbi:carboxypeptidase-like regulatory domain-containing protein [Thermofilum pendens]|uniref:Carboxypeptidase regulatory-like domain-containing protein n=1 Tax=Thermofilum pendens (strain DSM 2475 / Hrk 5) TaxID=368408 RepID=A1S035_THEPD|nr:carboxypeptidase-like regulatory domain-containing protein [Thermofilum pendens]ABL78815.1 hypothetical protein Tpen_1418 [Thermofilum pendens Hrk 5]
MRLLGVLLVAAVLLAPLAWGQPTLRIVAYDGTSLAGALVRVSTLDGRVYEFTLNPAAPFTVKDVVKGVLRVEVVSWKGVPVNYEKTVTVYENSTLVVPSIGRLTVAVKGARGQALPGALVTISRGGVTVEEGSAGSSGIYSTLLPAGTYEVAVAYGGRSARVEAVVEPSRESRVEAALDVVAEVGGWALSASELLGVSLLAVLAVFAVYVALYEYASWRKRRAARVVAPGG